MNKFLTMMLLLLSIVTPMFAQDDDENLGLDSLPPLPQELLDRIADTCRNPVVQNFALIRYQNYSKVYLEMGGHPVQSIGYKELDANSGFTTAMLQSGKAVLTNLIPGQFYTLQTANSCGVPVSFVFETDTNLQELIQVSGPFFEAITAYTRMDVPMSFTNYLATLTDISPYEKTAFIQQYFYRGKPFSNDIGDFVPPVPPLPDGPDTCFCNAIYTSQLALPGMMDLISGTIRDESQSGSSNDPKNMNGDPRARVWYWLNNRGAAKYHQLFTNAYKAKKGVDYVRAMTWQDSTKKDEYITSYQQSKLKINLLCMDGDEVPKECACEKTVEYWYRYDTRVSTESAIGNGGSGASVNSVSQVEDMGILSYFEEFDVEASYDPLGFVVARNASKCDRTPNSTFWTKAIDIYAAYLDVATQIYKSTQGGATVDTAQVRKLGNSVVKYLKTIESLINADYFDPTNCDDDADVFSSKEGSKIKKIRPNMPAVLAINSFDKLSAGGRRSWYSTARVLSNFYIAANIRHNAYDGTPVHCCSPKVGLWVLGSCDGAPLSTGQLKILVAEHLRLAGYLNLPPDPLAPGGVTVPREFGYLRQEGSKEVCNRLPINNSGGSGFGGGTEERSLSIQKDFQRLSIWDASGKMIANFTADDTQSADVNALVRERLQSVSAGMYFVRLEANGQTSTQKIFIK